MTQPLVAYKAFNANWTCRGFQYEVGKTYIHHGPVDLCNSGFHACEAPLDVLNYYPITDSKFARVELDGVTAKKDGDTKRAGTSIAVKVALSIADLISAQVEWALKGADQKSVAEGDYSTAASSGQSSTAASSGDYSKAASSGDYSTAACSGDYSKAASSGDYSTAACSGDYSTAACSGDYSTAACSGDHSKAASSGDYSTAACSGDYSKAACYTNGFACVAGLYGRVKGNAGSALSCGFKDAQGRNRIVVGYVGENGIKADTWYRADESGVLVEAK